MPARVSDTSRVRASRPAAMLTSPCPESGSSVRDNAVRPVLRDAEAPRVASFSPDGQKIAYSDRNDLYVYDIASQTTRRITDDGAWNEVINGTTDWVYEEEFGATRAYAFSPDSRRIAYLRFDESEVPLMEMMRFDGKQWVRFGEVQTGR